MEKPKRQTRKHIEYHRDGSIWARGQVVDGVMCGYWEWFRRDGTKMRSGFFVDGEQVGEWTTYDRQGKVYKVTQMKPKGTKKVAKKWVANKTAKKAVNRKSKK